VLEGYKAIADAIEKVWGIPVSVKSAWRYAQLEPEPLPIRYCRTRVIADRDEVERWARENIRTRQAVKTH